MPKVYLRYSENISVGSAPDAVKIIACTEPIKKEDRAEFRREDILLTIKSPRTVLQELEKNIQNALNEVPDWTDVLFHMPKKDSMPENINYPRHITYLAFGSWPKEGQTEKQVHEAQEKAQRDTLKRNIGIRKIYEGYIKHYQIRAEAR